MIQSLIVFTIIGLAALYLLRRLYRQAKGEDACGCGCSGCADPSGCDGHGAHFPAQQLKESKDR